jgi:c-di-GMP-binding flagellar brake protein YcgR
MSAPAKTRKKPHPETLLFRSRIEICRILQVLALERCRLTAELSDSRLFISRILRVDASTDHFAIAYCSKKTTNNMVLERPALEFTASDRRNTRYVFSATNPEETQVDGVPAIQYELPPTLILHSRREDPRLPVPADISLRCVADTTGIIPFESRVTDVSHDGLGCLIYEPNIVLDPGTVLRNCRIITPSGKAFVVDMELRHISSITLPDGSPAHRAGFRFAKESRGGSGLIDYFIQDIGSAA